MEKGFEGADLEAGAPSGAHSHSQGRNGEGLILAGVPNWQRSGLGKLKMQTCLAMQAMFMLFNLMPALTLGGVAVSITPLHI